MSTPSYDYEALAAGVGAGYDTASFADAYGAEESAGFEAHRRAITEGRDQTPWEAGFLLGWERFDAGLWPDGTSRNEDSDGN